MFRDLKNSQLRSEASRIIGENGILKLWAYSFLFMVFIFIFYCVFSWRMFGLCDIDLVDLSKFGKDILIYIVITCIYACLLCVLTLGYIGTFIRISRGMEYGIKNFFDGFRSNFINNFFMPFGFIIVMLPPVILIVLSSILEGLHININKAISMVLFFVGYVWYFIRILQYIFVPLVAADPVNHRYPLPLLFKVTKNITKNNKWRIFCMCFFWGIIMYIASIVLTLILGMLFEGIGIMDMDKLGYIAEASHLTVGTIVNGIYMIIPLIIVAAINFIVVYAQISIINLYIQLNDKYFNVMYKAPELEFEEPELDDNMPEDI